MLNFRDDNAGYIARNFKEPVTIDVARDESKQLIPADSKLLVTYRSGSTIEVDLYRSETLKTRFGEDAWHGGGPGDFIVMYRVEGGTVKSLAHVNDECAVTSWEMNHGEIRLRFIRCSHIAT